MQFVKNIYEKNKSSFVEFFVNSLNVFVTCLSFIFIRIIYSYHFNFKALFVKCSKTNSVFIT